MRASMPGISLMSPGSWDTVDSSGPSAQAGCGTVLAGSGENRSGPHHAATVGVVAHAVESGQTTAALIATTRRLSAPTVESRKLCSRRLRTERRRREAVCARRKDGLLLRLSVPLPEQPPGQYARPLYAVLGRVVSGLRRSRAHRGRVLSRNLRYHRRLDGLADKPRRPPCRRDASEAAMRRVSADVPSRRSPDGEPPGSLEMLPPRR